MPIQEPAESITGPYKKLQPSMGKNRVGIVSNFDGNFSNNYDGATNSRYADHVHYGCGDHQEYTHQPEMNDDDSDALVDGVHEYGYREVPD